VIPQKVAVLPLGRDPYAFTLFNITPPDNREDDDALFAPLELSWVVGGIDSGVGGRGKFAVPGRDDDRATPLLNAQRDDKGGAGASDRVGTKRMLRVRGFVDCGASHGIVSQAFVSLHGLRTIPSSSRGSCLLGDGSARVEHLGITEPVRVQCGTHSFDYTFHILRQAAFDLILGRDIMRMCGMVVSNVPAAFPSDVEADGPRREGEQLLLQRKRLTVDGPYPPCRSCPSTSRLSPCAMQLSRAMWLRARHLLGLQPPSPTARCECGMNLTPHPLTYPRIISSTQTDCLLRRS